MKVYFVRHGESEGNLENGVRQGSTTPLTNEGKRQAEIVARRFSKIPIDYIISSTNLRAKETADVINKVIGKSIDHSGLFVERRRPSEVVGKNKNDPIADKIGKLQYENFHIPGWHYSDEENFEDLKKRALDALDYLLTLSHEKVLVVTHGMFLKMLIACMVMGPELTSHEFRKFMGAFMTKNTGITLCEHSPVVFGKRDNPWHIVAWNDHAHLG